MKRTRVPSAFFSLFIALSVIAAPALSDEDSLPVARTIAAIDAAFSRGEISEGEAYLYKLAWLRNSSILPASFVMDDARPMKGATQLLLQIEEKMSTFAPEIQIQIKNLRQRPVCHEYVDTAHFRVHYNTSGTHMIYGWPDTDYRDAVLEAVEHCWQVFHLDHGWQIPPGDGSAGGGWNLIDCYVQNLPGYYGYAQPENTVPGDGWPNSRTGYFVIDNDYQGFGYTDRTLPMKVTVAHEYHHITQFGYTISNSWWMENVAVWAEELCYDDIDDYIPYIWQYMLRPYWRLYTYNGAFEYGATIWPMYIHERFGNPDLIRQIYHCSGTTGIHNCFDSVLSTQGYNFAAALAEWGVWNFYTHLRDDDQHYGEGGAWPYYMQFDKQYATYPQYNQSPTSTRRPEGTGTSVQRLVRDTGSTDNVLTIDYSGPACTQQLMIVCKEQGSHVFHEFYMNLDANGTGTLDVIGWDTMEYGHMICSFPLACGFQVQDYTFDLTTSAATSVEHPPLYTRTVSLEQNRPNPFGGYTQISYDLPVPGPVSLSVYDAGGRLVRQLVRAEQRPGFHHVHWDGRDDLGHEVAPGAYFCRLQGGGELLTRKMILTR